MPTAPCWSRCTANGFPRRGTPKAKANIPNAAVSRAPSRPPRLRTMYALCNGSHHVYIYTCRTLSFLWFLELQENCIFTQTAAICTHWQTAEFLTSYMIHIEGVVGDKSSVGNRLLDRALGGCQLEPHARFGVHRQMHLGAELVGRLASLHHCPLRRRPRSGRERSQVQRNRRKALQKADDHKRHFVVRKLESGFRPLATIRTDKEGHTCCPRQMRGPALNLHLKNKSAI